MGIDIDVDIKTRFRRYGCLYKWGGSFKGDSLKRIQVWGHTRAVFGAG